MKRNKPNYPLIGVALAIAAGGFFYVSRKKKIQACIDQRQAGLAYLGRTAGLGANAAQRQAREQAIGMCGDPAKPFGFI
jgi:LPXTG-motif cell wall-anchored protein